MVLRSSIKKIVDTAFLNAKKYKTYILLIAFLIGLGIVLGVSFQSIQTLLIIAIFFAVGAFSTMYKRYFRAPPAFELMTFTTVVVTMKYGLGAGLIYGTLVQIASEVLHGAIDAQIVIFVPARALLAVWTWVAMTVFGVTSVFWMGMIAIVAYNLMAQPISFFMGDVQLKAKTIYYTIFYSIANFFIFSIFSKPIAFLLGLQA